MGLIKPKKLKPGDTIGVMAPSGWGEREHIDLATQNLEKFGFKVKVHLQTYARAQLTAGSFDERLQALHDVFSDPSINAVFAARGGLRSMQLLDSIDYDIIHKHPKIFIGYSDSTYLLSTFYKRAHLVTFHGLSHSRYLPERPLFDQEYTLSFLQGKNGDQLWPKENDAETLHAGTAEGILFGGNLCLVTTLLAMDQTYRPDLNGKILCIEDIGEEIRQVDRMLSALRLSGAWEDLAGLVFGHMTDIADTGDHYPFKCSVRDLILEHVKDWKKPVVFNAPFGHSAPNLPFPLGVKARLTALNDGKAQLQLLESPFADA